MGHTMTFSLKNGSTRNISDTPTKSLGRLIASTSKTKNAATSELENRILSALKRLINAQIEANINF